MWGCAFWRRHLLLLWRRSVERASFALLIPTFKFGLLAMAPFPRCVVLLVTLALRRSMGADDFRAIVFGLEVFRASGGVSPPRALESAERLARSSSVLCNSASSWAL